MLVLLERVERPLVEFGGTSLANRELNEELHFRSLGLDSIFLLSINNILSKIS